MSDVQHLRVAPPNVLRQKNVVLTASTSRRASRLIMWPAERPYKSKMARKKGASSAPAPKGKMASTRARVSKDAGKVEQDSPKTSKTNKNTSKRARSPPPDHEESQPVSPSLISSRRPTKPTKRLGTGRPATTHHEPPAKAPKVTKRKAQCSGEGEYVPPAGDMSDSQFNNKISALKACLNVNLNESYEKSPMPKPLKTGEGEDYGEDSDDSVGVQVVSDDEEQEQVQYNPTYPEDDLEDDDDADDADDEEQLGGNMVIDNQEYEEHTPSKRWWVGNKESELCDLWAEERALYVFSETQHRDPNFRDNCHRRFAAILQIPREYIKFYVTN